MRELFENSRDLIAEINTSFIRPLATQIDWSWRLNGIIGARGTGKTTLLLQHLSTTHGIGEEAVYISLDDIYFSSNRLIDFIKAFRLKGGKYLYIDEVHKYPEWAREIKNVHDLYKDIQITFTGSSIIDILKQDVDLSRRAVIYELPGLSFREFLLLSGIKEIEAIPISDLVKNHQEISMELTKDFRPLKYFEDYLTYGYYPFFLEGTKSFKRKLKQVINLVIQTDLNFIEGYDPKNARKVNQLLYILASNVPFKPNISKLSDKIGIHRNTLIQYLHYLEKASVIHLVNPEGISISTLQKPEKVYLRNTNLAYALAPDKTNIGSLRETFFISQVQPIGTLNIPMNGDFSFEDRYIFEIGGQNKGRKQINELKNAHIVSDEIERGIDNRIPLWLFGLLY
ncbi:AAA family ATPase [Fulvivirgaceae bacterium BMA12]|uniref:AAA family ATPase n=1 Tax=Agaribacillus aureus TaxID=3051825 RepID=A0ABT8LBS4_9BACT|nr:AAA family ATPase [Fulvivirgaceae bacterium BMA12]